MIGSLQVWRRRLRTLGVGNVSLLALKRVLARASLGRAQLFKYRLVAQPVPADRWLSPRRGADIDVRLLAADAPELASLPRPSSVIAARFRQGAECLCASRGGEAVGFLWYTVGDYHEDEVRCRFSPRPREITAWDFDVYVDPAHRLGPAFLRLWDEANQRLREQGVRWSLSRIDAFNAASMHAHRRMGAVAVGTLVFLVLGRLQLTMGSQLRWFHAGFSSKSRPHVAPSVECLEGKDAWTPAVDDTATKAREGSSCH